MRRHRARVCELVVDYVDVEVQFAAVFGFGQPDFEFEDHESA